MKIEEMFIIFISWFVGMLAVGLDVLFNKVFYTENHYTYFALFSLVCFGFAIYFTFKFTELINKKRKKRKYETNI